MDQNKVWMIVPAFNEAAHIEKVLKAISLQTSNIIVADDGSTDATVKIAQKYTPHVLVHTVNLGKGAALKTACDYAFFHQNAQAVIMLDADGQHDPSYVKQFIQRFQTGQKLIFGVRDVSHMPFDRQFGNRLATKIIRLRFGITINDILCGFKAFTKEIYPTIRWQAQGYEVELEIAANAARHHLPFTYLKIPTTYHPYVRGMNAIDAVKMVSAIITI